MKQKSPKRVAAARMGFVGKSRKPKGSPKKFNEKTYARVFKRVFGL